MAIIVGVDEGSIAEDLGIKAGDELVAFDDRPLEDLLDYYYYDGMEDFVMTVKSNGEIVDYEIEKEPYEAIGVELDDSVQLEPIRCKNKCKFCFVDQLPKGMRETLYVKDDDYRLSFISGNFITLTNVKDKELERIIRMKLSPLYISVHATSPEIKQHLVANPEGRKTYAKIKLLASNGIRMNTQIVMCPGENDGEVLYNTLSDLAKLRPMVLTTAVVPVGLTGHRKGLYELHSVDKDCAQRTIELVEDINRKFGKFVWCSDEFYIIAGKELPKYEDYGDFEQIENGVGLVRVFEREVEYGLEDTSGSGRKIEISCITGVSFGGQLAKCLVSIKSKFPNLTSDVCVVKNKYFGESITVAGLITGTDIIAQYKGKLKQHVILPSNTLREFTDSMLDNMTVDELEKELGATIHICSSGEQLVEIIDSIEGEQNE